MGRTASPNGIPRHVSAVRYFIDIPHLDAVAITTYPAPFALRAHTRSHKSRPPPNAHQASALHRSNRVGVEVKCETGGEVQRKPTRDFEATSSDLTVFAVLRPYITTLLSELTERLSGC